MKGMARLDHSSAAVAILSRSARKYYGKTQWEAYRPSIHHEVTRFGLTDERLM